MSNLYTIFLPDGEVVEKSDGVPEIYRIAGTIVRGTDDDGETWHHWDKRPGIKNLTWYPMKPEEVPAHIRATALLIPQ